MALENISVVGMTLQPDDPTVVATIVITGTASTKVNATTGVYQDGLAISVSAITVPTSGATIPDPGPYSTNMNATSTKVKAETLLVLRVGDLSDTINATPKIPSSPNPIDYPVSFKIEIANAGQTKVLGE